MKKIFLLIILSIPLIAYSQEKTKQKEVGLVFNNLDNFGVAFKSGTNKSMWRFNVLSIRGMNMSREIDSLTRTNNSNGFGIGAGKEFLFGITDNLEFRIGGDINFSYHYSKSDNDDKSVDYRDSNLKLNDYDFKLNLVLGFNYTVNNKIIIGAELLPGISYGFGSITRMSSTPIETTEIIENNSGFNYGLSNTSARLSLMYRF